ncbi:MAG: AAA family ATPase [Bacteroidota bacterium]
MAKKLYIAATGQHKGKTTCTLGLAAAIHRMGINVGYCKPVGQKHLIIDGKMTDKDTVLFEDMLQFKVRPEIHSPIIIASGLTADFIEKPEQFDFAQKVESAAAYLEKTHDIIVYEGTGHVGVGSIINLSNAQVAKMLGAEVILIAEGGIGRTFDRLNLNLSLFREQNVPIKGVIVNKIHADKLEHVRTHIEARLKQIGIPLLAALPFDRTLSFPLIATIKKNIKGKVLLNAHRLDNQVEEILAGSSLEIDEFTYFQNMLLITNQNNFRVAVEEIEQHAKERGLDASPLSGVILTGDGKNNVWLNEKDLDHPYLIQHEIPVLATVMDTYDAVVAISSIEVKINTKTPWKIERAIELIQENLDVAALIR